MDTVDNLRCYVDGGNAGCYDYEGMEALVETLRSIKDHHVVSYRGYYACYRQCIDFAIENKLMNVRLNHFNRFCGFDLTEAGKHLLALDVL